MPALAAARYCPGMSGEIGTIIAVGIGLAGLIFTGNVRIEARLAALEAIVGDLRERVARIEVKLEPASGVPGHAELSPPQD